MITIAPVSAGGHLEELLCLLPRIADPSDTVYVTYDVEQARASLPSSSTRFAYHPTTKNVPNAIRNYRLARQLFREWRSSQVISTGAAVAVPFMLRARQLGLPCHYIESATRVASPSLSGRMLERLPGVRLYSQHAPYNDRWTEGPSVFDGFSPGPQRAIDVQAARRDRRRILVSLGTHDFPFPVLVKHLHGQLGKGDDVLWQLGSTRDPGDLVGRTAAVLPMEELRRELNRADVVVGHAGVGLTLMTLSVGKVPVLVPRRRHRREHTDDHQVQFARSLEERGLAIVAEVGELNREHLERAAVLTTTHAKPSPFALVR